MPPTRAHRGPARTPPPSRVARSAACVALLAASAHCRPRDHLLATRADGAADATLDATACSARLDPVGCPCDPGTERERPCVTFRDAQCAGSGTARCEGTGEIGQWGACTNVAASGCACGVEGQRAACDPGAAGSSSCGGVTTCHVGTWGACEPAPCPDAGAPGTWVQICSAEVAPFPCPSGADVPYVRGWNYNLPYAPSRGTLLYMGGANVLSSNFVNSVWEYSVATHRFNRLTWTGTSSEICPRPGEDNPAPAPPYWDGTPSGYFVVDPTRDRAVITQLACSGAVMRHTWALDLTRLTWAELGTGAWDGVARIDGAMAYDPAHDLLITYGGNNTSNTLTVFDPVRNVWTDHTMDQRGAAGASDLPGNLGGGRLLYDSADRRLYLYGGYRVLADVNSGINDLWVLDAATVTWTMVHPAGGVKPPASGENPWIVYDSARNRLVQYVAPGETWQYDIAANAWSRLPIVGGPQARLPSGAASYYTGAVGYDPAHDAMVVIVFGAAPSVGWAGPDVWELHF